VFVLSGHGTGDIAERWVVLNDAERDEVFETEKVVLLTYTVEVASAERKRVKVLVDGTEQAVCRVNADGDGIGQVLLARIVRALALVDDVASTGGAKGLDGVVFAFLHLDLKVRHVDDGYRLASVDRVAFNAVTVEVLNALDPVRLAIGLEFVRFHDLLDRGTNLTETGIDTGFLDTSVGSGFNGRQQRVPGGLKVEGESRVDDATLDVNTKIDLEHIPIL